MNYLTTQEKTFEFLSKNWPSEITQREKVVLVYLDHARQVLGFECLFQGGYDCCTLDCRTVFRYALKHDAHYIVVAHNHPNGSVSPSAQDIEVTEALTEYGKVLGIPVAHFIITRNRFKALAFF